MKTKRFRLMVFIAVLILAMVRPVAGQDENPVINRKTGGDYRVGAGDLLRIVVWKNEDISGEFRVRPDGKFSMPLIGDILAEDTTTDGISMQIEQKLKLFIESPFVATIVLEASSNRIYVLGEVVTPGTYPIEGSLTVLQALAISGGFTEFAKRDKMVLIRGTGKMQEKITLNYSTLLKNTKKDNNLLLKRGDTLVIP